MKSTESVVKEFKRLKGQTYLDHAGATMYADSQIENASKDLINNFQLNPHTSKYTSDCIDQVRSQILRHFNTDHKEYTVIFTSGSTASLKIVAESFAFSEESSSNQHDNGVFAYLQDNHTSVLGMREIADSKLADVVCIPHNDLVQTMTEEKNHDLNDNSKNCGRALFVYPAMCNFSGFKYPLEWMEKIKRKYLNTCLKKKIKKCYDSWFVMLDTAAFVSTNRLDLSKYKPDYICVSFYKMFGFPTGIGALIVRNEIAYTLSEKRYYGGGTVEIAMSGINHHVKRKKLYERFEDGTIAFLSILSLKHGFDTLNTLIPKHLETDHSMDVISLYTFQLASQFYNELKSLRHYNGARVSRIYSDTDYNDTTNQGGIVNFNLLRANGDFVGYSEVVFMCQLFNIHLRSGCFCNPGACQRFLKLSDDDLIKHHNAGHVCGDNYDLINGIPTGSLRVSFGYMSTKKDVDNIIEMFGNCFVENGPITFNSNFNILKADDNKTQSSAPLGILHEIDIYPIKSCAAFKITDKWEIGLKGLKYDREWMIVTENGVALSQKQDTRICLITPFIDLLNQRLTLSFPGADKISIPLEREDKEVITENSICHSKVCGDRIIGYDCGNEVADWLLDVLGTPGLRLIKQNDDEVRVSKKNTAEKIIPISLTNQAQYLVINLTSVHWLSDKVESREFNDRIVNLKDRFRGNFIVETKRPFEELSWKKIQIDGVDFEVEGPCRRCQMVCIDQETGDKTIEPLRTISKYFEGKLNFGVYLSHQDLSKESLNSLKCKSIIYEITDE